MMYLKEITDGTDELDVFDESSNLFTLKNWTSKAIPMSQTFAVLCDMMVTRIALQTKSLMHNYRTS